MQNTLKLLLDNNEIDFPINLSFSIPKFDKQNNKYTEERLNSMCTELIYTKAIEQIPKTITISRHGTLFYITWIQNLSDETHTIDMIKTRFEREILVHVKLHGKLHKINTNYPEYLFKNPLYTILP